MQGRRRLGLAILLGAGLFAPPMHLLLARTTYRKFKTMTHETSLNPKQRAIPAISAAAAVGDLERLNAALEEGLDAGLALGEAKEILVQMYAYAGFPRSLNALGELMKLNQARLQRGLHDPAGRDPGPVPIGKELLALGTANQTQLSGAPVKGPLFEFAPAIDTFLKAHLFGDIFARDNLDWQSRELATVGALAAMTGVEAQLLAHMRIGINTGLTRTSLREVADVLEQRGHPEAATRARAALDAQTASG
jgi:alkylhydroperoxidase/carboxymuconolactone decarboxylase family protein YurZ